jgi:DNA-binding transcriptional LysR family regulator
VELDWLVTFLAVVDLGGFTAASQHLHRAQSRVSAHIAALERELGVRLFDRSRRPAALTPAGDVFVRHAREVVAELASARSAVGSLTGLEQNRLTLVATPAIATAFLPHVLARLTAELRGVRVEVVEQSAYEARHLVSEGAAMAVHPVVPPALARGLDYQLLWQERLVLLVGQHHRLAAHRGPVPLDLLAVEPVVVCRTTAHAEPIDSLVPGPAGMPARARLTVETPQTLAALVRAGIGVGVLGAVALHGFDLDGLVAVGLRGNAVTGQVAAYWGRPLLSTEVGRRLHRAVLQAPLPPGAQPPSTPLLHAVPLEPGEHVADG